MAKEILTLEDYADIQILGLEPKDRQPHDYLRFVAKIFNSFKNINPSITVSSYLSGFVTNIIDLTDDFQFIIEKGTCYIDDQFIAFTDDIFFRKEKSYFINNLDYFLILKYQYSTSYPGPVPTFEFCTEAGFNPEHMLKILKFKIDGIGVLAKAIAYPQNLDNLFMENFPRLFELLESKVVESMDIMKYQFYKITPEELYVNTVDPDRSAKSGDIIYLDTIDKLYKPARACNKRLDKAIGIYLYNGANNDHIIATAGMIDFSVDFALDSSNLILENLEAGRSYYLLDGCTETNYSYENEASKQVSGKMSSRFFPGTVRAGFAIDNTNFMIDFDFSSDMNIKNIMEIIGMPEEFSTRFEIFFNYYIAMESKERLEVFIDELTIAKNAKILEVDDKSEEVDTVLTPAAAASLSSYEGTLLTPAVSEVNLKEFFDSFLDSLGKANTDNSLGDASIYKAQHFIPALKGLITESIINLESIKTILGGVQSINDPGTYNFTAPEDLPSIISGIPNARSDTGTLDEYSFQTIRDWGIANLQQVLTLDTTVHNVAERPRFYALDTDSDITTTSITHVGQPTYITTSLRTAKVGHTELTRVDVARNVLVYTAAQTLVWGNNIIGTYQTNTSTLVNGLTSIISVFNSIDLKLDEVLTTIDTKNTVELLEASDAATAYSFMNHLNDINDYLFDRTYSDAGNLPDQISKVVAQAELIDRAELYNTANKNTHLSAVFKISDNVYKVDYAVKQLQHMIRENIVPFLDQITDAGTLSTDMDTSNAGIDTYITERNIFEDSKYTNFQIYSASKMSLDKGVLERIQLQSELDKEAQDLDSLNGVILPGFETQIADLDSSLLARINEESSIHEIFYLSNHERAVYNYTYITLRLRLKYKNKTVIENNISIISDKLFLLKNEPIPDYDLIVKLEGTQVAYQSVLNTLNEEMISMIAEYNTIRVGTFGIEAIVLGDEDFDDGGFANPDLNCFASLQ